MLTDENGTVIGGYHTAVSFRYKFIIRKLRRERLGRIKMYASYHILITRECA